VGGQQLDGARRRSRLIRLARQRPWSVLRTDWLDLPIGQDACHANLTWMNFAESFDLCLRGVSLHVAGCVDDRARLEGIVTRVFVDHLHVLVGRMGDCEKLDLLLSAADRLIEREA
jgi:hypothetical protein